MAARGDTEVREAVRAALASGPKDFVALRDQVVRRAPARLAGREGRLHALLHGMVRRGEIVPTAPAASGLVRYALPPAGGGPAAPEPVLRVAEAEARVARQVAAGARNAEDRARIEADVVAHRAALARADEAAGPGRSFGPVRALRHLLRRVDRGRPTVVFTAGAGDVARKLLWHEGPWLLGAVVAFLLIRTFLAEVFVIPSASMVPTLLEGDRVLVVKPGGTRMPDRWAIVTFVRDGTTYVKRAVGRGGEDLLLLGGDLYVDGSLVAKPPELAAQLRAPYARWDLGGAALPEGWSVAPEDGGQTLAWTGPVLWSGGTRGGLHHAADVPLRDAYATLDVERPSGASASLALVYRAGGAATDAEGGEDAVFLLAVDDEGARLQAEGQGRTRFALHEAWVGGASAAPHGRIRLALSYVDGVLSADVGGARWSRDVEPSDRPQPRAAVLPRIGVAGGARALVLGLDRDLHYSGVGHLAVAPSEGDDDPWSHAFHVPEGAVFFLGDNTYNSRDSRFAEVGAIPTSSLTGPVLLRIWPPGRVGRVR